jgi:hypothetical protein
VNEVATPMTRPVTGIQPLSGPAFPLAVRLLASALVAGLLYGALRSRTELLGVDWNGWTAAVVGSAMLMTIWSLVWMWCSRTGVDTRGIHQTWIRDRHVAWQDISQARLVAVPFLEGLVTPRLVVRPRGGGTMVFHSADPQVLGVFAAYVTCGVPPFSTKEM